MQNNSEINKKCDIMLNTGGLFSMKNENLLIALAYIKETQNPLIVFSNYIIICLQKNEQKELSLDEIKSKIVENFGLNMPVHILKACCRMLEKENKIKRIPKSSKYLLIDDSFNLEAFEKQQEDLLSKEKTLISDLCNYVLDYNLSWDYKTAREHLTAFLFKDGNAVSIFSGNNIDVISWQDEKNIPPEWYVGKYITFLLEQKTITTNYLLDVVNGLMIYIGIYEIGDYQQDKEQKFRNTKFYFDTKLILRLMGFSWELEVQSAKELVDLITKEYGGEICVFDHTISEVEMALRNAAQCLKTNQEINDYELNIYAQLNDLTDFDFEIVAVSVREIIEEKLHFSIQEDIDWNNETVQIDTLDWEELQKYIKSRHPHWKDKAIENDVRSISYINILRKSDYSVKYGGKKRLPVFVTSNFALVADMKNYIEKCGYDDKLGAKWNTRALPITTDNFLMCRLWMPKAKSLSSFPAMTLARNAYAAQQVNKAFFEKLRTSALKLRENQHIDAINIPKATSEKLEEILIKNIAGDIDKITEDTLFASIKEYSKLENIDLIKESERKSKQIEEEQSQKIISATKRMSKVLPFSYHLLPIINYLWIFATIAFALLEMGLSYAQASNIAAFIPHFAIIYVIGICILKILEEKVIHVKVRQRIMEKAVQKVWEHFTRKIAKELLDFEEPYIDSILESCKKEYPIFSEYAHCTVTSKQ